jgi:phage shock protein A
LVGPGGTDITSIYTEDWDYTQGTCAEPNSTSYWGMDLRPHVNRDPHYAVSNLIRAAIDLFFQDENSCFIYHFTPSLTRTCRPLLSPWVGFEGLCPVINPPLVNSGKSVQPKLPGSPIWSVHIEDIISHYTLGKTISEWDPIWKHLSPPFCHLDGSFYSAHPYDDPSITDEIGPIKKLFLFCYYYYLFHYTSSDDIIDRSLRTLLSHCFQVKAYADSQILQDLHRMTAENSTFPSDCVTNLCLHGNPASTAFVDWREWQEISMIDFWDCPWTRPFGKKQISYIDRKMTVSAISRQLAAQWESQRTMAALNKETSFLINSVEGVKESLEEKLSHERVTHLISQSTKSLKKSISDLDGEIEDLQSSLKDLGKEFVGDKEDSSVPSVEKIYKTLSSLSTWSLKVITRLKARDEMIDQKIQKAHQSLELLWEEVASGPTDHHNHYRNSRSRLRESPKSKGRYRTILPKLSSSSDSDTDDSWFKNKGKKTPLSAGNRRNRSSPAKRKCQSDSSDDSVINEAPFSHLKK